MRLTITILIGAVPLYVSTFACGQYELHQAVETGDGARIKKLISDKADVNRRREPAKAKVDPKKPMFEFKTEGQWMVWYAQKKQEAHLELPLHGAIYLERTEIVPLLLAAGARPNLKLTIGGKTALHVAAEGRHVRVVETLGMLIQAGGDLDLADDQGYTVLNRLIDERHEDGVAFVLTQKVSVNAQGYLKRTPLHWAAQTNQPKLVRRLIDAGADLNLGDGWATPLEAALYRGNIEMANELIRAGAKANALDKTGQTLLHHIMHWPDTQTVRFALRHKVPIDAQDSDGNTALHLAFKNVWREDAPCHARPRGRLDQEEQGRRNRVGCCPEAP